MAIKKEEQKESGSLKNGGKQGYGNTFSKMENSEHGDDGKDAIQGKRI